MKAEYRMRVKVWVYPGKGGWHFATVPKKQSAEIRARFATEAKGWGSLPVSIRIGRAEWSTSLFPERKTSCYLFPIKAAVRKKEGIAAGDSVLATVQIR